MDDTREKPSLEEEFDTSRGLNDSSVASPEDSLPIPPERILRNFLDQYEQVALRAHTAFCVSMASYFGALYTLPEHGVSRESLAFWSFGCAALCVGFLLNNRKHSLREQSSLLDIVDKVKNSADE